MANLRIDENTKIGNTPWSLKDLLNNIDALYTRTNKISDEMKKMSNIITGEYNLYDGNKYFISDGTWKWLCDNYSAYSNLLKKFPLKDGYTRSYKLCLEKSDSITVSNSPLYISLFNWYVTDEHIQDFLFEQSWGSSEDGILTYYEIDFDINLIKDRGHLKWCTTPPFIIGSGYAWRIYRLYIRVIDTYTGVPF